MHVFEALGEHLVLDVGSGVLHRVDKDAAEVIDLISKGYEEKEIIEISDIENSIVKEVIEEVNILKEKGLIFADEIVTEYSPKLDDTVVKALCLHIAHDCNMRCQYCFAETGEYKVGKRELMSIEVAKKAIDYLLESSLTRTNLEVDFFGGEPLLNFEVVKETVKYAKAKEVSFNKNIRFTLTTNGILLDDKKIDSIKDNEIQLIMSHDGREEVHNKMRPLTGKKGSYKRVTKNFKNAIIKGIKDYHIRGTFTSYNKDFMKDIKHIIELGFNKISFEPVVTDLKEEYALHESDLTYLKDEYKKLAEYYLDEHKNNNPFTFFHYEIDLNQGPCLAKRLSGCGAGYDYLAVAPNGDLYPCHQFVGIDEFKMGNVSTSGYKKDIAEKFINAHVLNKSKCNDCFAKYYCSGGCHADAYFRNGNFYEPVDFSCELQKTRVEYALAIRACLNNEK
ncbi:MAG: thioether cross-link-forming SCIFF peptide maturase [Clostridia bacterium]